MLSEKISLNSYSILSDKTIRLSYLTQIFKGNALISSSVNEELIIPGQDVSDREEEIQTVCAAIWTPEVVAAYRSEGGIK